MFETFSKKFESIFRVIFIIWVSFWGTIDLGSLLFQYASFNNDASNSELSQWWLNTLGTVITISSGVFLLFIMSNVPGVIKQAKRISNIGLMTILTVVYYLFITLIKIIGVALFNSQNFAREFIFLSAWLFPSIILLIIHVLYFTNLRKYNEQLEKNNEKKSVA